VTGGNPADLWIAVVLIGLYHGISPGMGWPLAVSAALFEGRPAALFKALLAIGIGHLSAICLVLLPFAALQLLVARATEVRVGAGLLLVTFGLLLLAYRRHPRMLARIRPDQLLLWAFVIALAHGAGLMLVPMYLGIAVHDHMGAVATGSRDLMTLMAVSMLHTAAMVASGGAVAWLVYRHLGLQFLRKSWFNLQSLWALSLILIGSVSLFFSGAGHS
jgi:hypothetical protein